jgi:uncharacterized protein YdeI (YjbR/CyaY-like superfamily)
MGLEETAKWAHPCYMHAGRNIVVFGAFRTDFRLSFMNPGLLRDTENVLEPQGPNSQTPGMIRFTSIGQVGEREPVIRAYLRQLMDHAEAGTKPPKVSREIDMPDELTEALDADPEMAEAFQALTPGRQKSYMFNLNQAKQSATRVARIEKFREKIIAGKGAMER